MPKTDVVRLSDNLIESFLILIIIFSPLLYGCVDISCYVAIEFLIFFAVLIWFFKMTYLNNISFLKITFFLPLLLFIILVILQIIILPKVILGFIPYTRVLGTQGTCSSSLSIYPEVTFLGLFKLLGYFAILFLVLNNLASKEQFERLFNTIIFLGVSISIFGIFQKYTYSHLQKVYWFDSPGTAPAAFGPFANRNHFAGYIEMIIPLTLGYILSDIDSSKKMAYAGALFIMSVALFLTSSRAGMFIYISILLFILLFMIFKKITNKKLILVFAFYISSLIVVLFILGISPIWERVTSIFHGSKGIQSLGRGYFWRDILRIWFDYPFFGTGLGTFASISAKYKSAPVQIRFTYAHNDYLQLLTETGILGFSLVFLFFITYFKRFLKMWFKRRDAYVTGLSLGGLISIWAIMLHSVVDFNLHIPANALLFFIIMGSVYRLLFSNFRNQGELYLRSWRITLPPVITKILFIFFVFLFLFSGSILFSKVRAERTYNHALEYTKTVENINKELAVDRALGYKRALRLLEKAQTINPYDSRYPYRYADLLTAIITDKDIADLIELSHIKGQKDNLYQLAESNYGKAICLEPTEPLYHLNLGYLHMLMNDIPGAKEEFNMAESLDPYNLNNHIYLAKFSLSQNKEKEAFLHLCKANILVRGLYDKRIDQLNIFHGLLVGCIQGNNSKIVVKQDEISLRLDLADLPLTIDCPLDLRVILKDTKPRPGEVNFSVAFPLEGIMASFPLELKSVQDGTLLFETKDIYNLAISHALKNYIRHQLIELNEIIIPDKYSDSVQSIELVFKN